MNGLNKKRVREKPTKKECPSVQGIVKTPLEVVKIEIFSHCPHRCSLHDTLTMEYPRLKQQKILDSICFPLLLLFSMAQKAPGFAKYTFQHGSIP